MPAPYNYDTLGNVPDPSQALAQGLQIGAAIRGDQFTQQQQQQALAAQQQQQAVLQRLISNPNAGASDYANAAALLPKDRAEQVLSAWKLKSEDQQQNELRHASQVFAALSNGRPDVAQSLLTSRATAMKNSGAAPEQMAPLQAMQQVIEQNPDFARAMIGTHLAALPGGDKLLGNLSTMGKESREQAKAPAELRQANATADKAVADAQTAGVNAKYAEQGALLDLQKKGWDIKAIGEDIEIKKAANRIAAMNAQTSRINSDTQRQELALKIQEAKAKLDDKVREKVGRAESAAADIDNAINTIERIKKNPSLNAVIGSLEGSAYYPNATLGTLNPFGNGDERADAIALIETLGSQSFLSQVPKMAGMGQLTEREGAKLEAALTNLSRVQSEKQFRANLDEAARLLNKGRENLSRTTGVPLPKPDTPAKPGARPPLDSFNR